jgi:hypothetical protein
MESIRVMITYVGKGLDMAIVNILVLVSIELDGDECTGVVLIE